MPAKDVNAPEIYEAIVAPNESIDLFSVKSSAASTQWSDDLTEPADASMG